MEPILISDTELVEDTTEEELSIQAWRAEQLRKLARTQAVLSALDEQQQQVEGPSGSASDSAPFPHGA